ncbi:MAG TPA: helix-turn-helix domain-containing protein [Polyangiaceae bacterium]|nr:helix-turn-helix domain-containing protein [Polyangiaceae bacterium]
MHGLTSGRSNKAERGRFSGPRHALLAPSATHIFALLEIAITLWEPGRWHEIHERSYALDIIGFELEHGDERARYNASCLLRARRSRRTVVAERHGLRDLFVPVMSGKQVLGVLVTGPFATQRPQRDEVLRRWRAIAGRQGDPRDPEFLRYLFVTAETLVLDQERVHAFQKLVECVACLLAGEGSADKLLKEIEVLGKKLLQARLVDRTWTVAQALIDERTSRSWTSPARAVRLWDVGLKRFPEQVLVGLFVNREANSDPVDEFFRRDAFQRACAALAYERGNAAGGKIGSHGVTFFCTSRGSPQRTRRYLLELAEEAASMARRRFGLALHIGVSSSGRSLSQQFREALAVAESALMQGVRVKESQALRAQGNPLAPLRKQLAWLVEHNPQALPASFERYAEAVTTRAGHRLDLTRAELDGGFERIAEALAKLEAVDERSLDALSESLRLAADEADSVSGLRALYQSAVSEASRAVIEPRTVQRDRSLRQAEDYMRKHFSEPLSLARVARVGGFTPNYFSELFHKKMSITFEQHLIWLRVEHARHLLNSTSWDLARIAKLCGCSTREYLGRMFKRCTGETPIAYRKRVSKELIAGVKPLLPRTD